jgi:hypothetical protein
VTGRRKIEERIKKKELEIQELEGSIREARAYIQAMHDALKLLPRDASSKDEGTELRPGSMIARARDAIQEAGRPLHISELLAALGKDNSRSSKASLAGSLAAYVRANDIFTRPKPNTFGLIGGPDGAESDDSSPPIDFGLDDEIPF